MTVAGVLFLRMTGGDGIDVLHVDDDDAFLRLAATTLEGLDSELSVTPVSNPEMALEQLDPFDCVVSDYDMPRMDGLSLFESVRERRPELPFILFTGKGSEEIAADAVSAGVTDYLQKEVGTDQFTVLSNRIRNAVARKRARRQARRQRDRAAALVRNSPNPIVETRFRDGEPIIADVNPAFERTFGYQAGDVIDQPLDELIVPDDKFAEAASINERTLAGEEFRTEVRRETADGIRDFVVTAIPFSGQPRGFAIYTDITEQKDRQRALAKREQKVETLHDVALAFDDAATHQDVHDQIVAAAEGILQYDLAISNAVSDETLVPQAVSSALDENSYYGSIPVDDERSEAARVFRLGSASLTGNISAEDADPADAAFESALTVPIGDYGVFQAVAEKPDAFDEEDLQLTDILVTHAVETLRRLDRETELESRTEQLRRQNERLESFASVVSHDLTSPLNVASGRLQMARDDSAGDENLAAVERAHDRMEQILDDVLTMVRDGSRVEETEPVRLSAIVNDCCDAVPTSEASVTQTEDCTVIADPDRLTHVVQNLLRNAAEHGGAGVSIAVGVLSDDNGFYVADDGPGIPADQREAVFRAGYSSAEHGTGLGLNIVREMAEAHDWEVRVTESADDGARFEVTGVELTGEPPSGERRSTDAAGS